MKHQKNHPYNQGVIYKKTTGTYSVHSNGEVILCSLSSQFHHETEVIQKRTPTAFPYAWNPGCSPS